MNLSSFGQSEKAWSIEAKEKVGFMIAKRGEVSHLPRHHAVSTELSLVLHTYGKKKWHQAYRYPIVGLTGSVVSVGNPSVLGTFYGGYAFIEFPFINHSTYLLTGKVASGLAYTSKIYDPILNPKNSVISSHLNAMICFGIMNKFRFKRSVLSLGLDLTHFSNGAFKVPNIGINMPFLSLGYAYNFKTKEKQDDQIYKLPYRKLLVGLATIVSAKEIYPTGQGHKPVYELSTFARYFFGHKVGAELSLDVVSKQVIFNYRPEISKNQLDVIQIGLYGGYLLPLDRFHLVIGMGVQLRDKFQPESRYYHRIGMRYYFDNGVHANLVLRSNWAKADFVEWGIGYTFNYKTK